MPAVLTIDSVKKTYFQAQNETVLEVSLSIIDGEGTIKRSLSFPLDTSSDVLKVELKKYIDNYNLEKEQASANKERDDAEKQADETIADVEGITIS